MSKTVFIAGHNGMVGSAIKRRLEQQSINVICAERSELDLLNQAQVNDFFAQQPIDEVYLAAAKVGGISANNNFPAEFIYQNLMIECNLIHAAHQANVNKLLFLGSSCIYPKMSPQPIPEDALLTGYLEPTNEPYAIAKIAGIKLCESYNRQYGRDYRSVMPTNLYGPGDNYHPENSHVIPGLIRRFHEAKVNQAPEVVVWGTGKALREFLYIEDMASACELVMNLPQAQYQAATDEMQSHINVGTGEDCSIKELAELICKVTGYPGKLVFDTSKPDGTPRKLLNVGKLKSMGWNAEWNLENGLKETYRVFVEDVAL